MTKDLEWFDTHAHLNDPQLQANLDRVISDAHGANVMQMVAVGIDLKSSYQCIEIAEKTAGIYASVGVHPNNSHLANEFHWSEIVGLLDNEKVVALGETGLDCYWDDCPLDIQQIWFAKHIQLSHESGLPIIVHQRESEEPILKAFQSNHENGKIDGIMHSFTGSWETAETCLNYGMYISFAGMVTFKNAQAIRDVAMSVPDDRILIETDSPYLTPHPFRGKRPNHPAMVAHTAQCLAGLKGMSDEEFAKLTTTNAKRVFKL